jgi:IS5 family transposase
MPPHSCISGIYRVDAASGLVHTLTGTAANEAGIIQTAALLHGQEEDVFDDAGYSGADKRPELAERDVSGNIAIRRSIIKARPKALRDLAEPVERALAQLRAVVEHPFHIVKNRFRHKKLRYRGLKRNTAQLYTLVRPGQSGAGQSGDRQTGSARPTGWIMGEVYPDAATAGQNSNRRPEISPRNGRAF